MKKPSAEQMEAFIDVSEKFFGKSCGRDVLVAFAHLGDTRRRLHLLIANMGMVINVDHEVLLALGEDDPELMMRCEQINAILDPMEPA